MKKIVVLSRKGGVGKTTTLAALGAGLIRKKKSVLYVDCDGQANLTLILGAQETEHGSYSLIMGTEDPKTLIQEVNSNKIIAAHEMLNAIDTEIALKGRAALQKAPEKLKTKLALLGKQFDYCLIDTPAALNVVTENCLVAADKVIIPVIPDILSLQGIPRVMEMTDYIKQEYNENLCVDGFLLCKYSDRNPFNRYMFEQLGEYSEKYKVKIYETKIRESISLRESQATLNNIFDYDKKSKTAIDYEKFVDNFLKGDKKK